MAENTEKIVRATIRLDTDLYDLLEKRVQERKKRIGRSHSINAEIHEALRAWFSLPPPTMEDPDGRLRRIVDGVRALYALPGEEPHVLLAALVTGLKAAGVWPPSGRRRRADGE